MTKLCPACKGRKKIMGMGMMMTDCSTCKALGYVDSDYGKFGFDKAIEEVEKPEVKKRGRRKRDEHQEVDKSFAD